MPSLNIDADYLRALDHDDALSSEEKATDIEAAIVHEIKVRGEDDPLPGPCRSGCGVCVSGRSAPRR
jgi:hypothetical protein